MDRILKYTGCDHTSVSESWINIWTPKIIKQAKIEISSSKKLKFHAVSDSIADKGRYYLLMMS